MLKFGLNINKTTYKNCLWMAWYIYNPIKKSMIAIRIDRIILWSPLILLLLMIWTLAMWTQQRRKAICSGFQFSKDLAWSIERSSSRKLHIVVDRPTSLFRFLPASILSSRSKSQCQRGSQVSQLSDVDNEKIQIPKLIFFSKNFIF